MSRITVKIISSIVLSILVAAVTIGTVSITRASAILDDEILQKFHQISKGYSNQFSLLLSEVETSIQTFASTVEVDFSIDDFKDDSGYRENYMSKTKRAINLIAEESDSIQGIYLAINPELTGSVYESWLINKGNGNFIYQEPEDISTFYPENEDMKWYYDSIRMNHGVWSRPYTDATIDIKMISYTQAIYSGEELIGVAGIDIQFNEIFETLNSLILYKNGYAILTDSDYRVIFHPTIKEGTALSSLENENFDSIVEAMQTDSSGVLLYKFQNTDKIMGFSRLSNGWMFLAVTDLDDINAPINRLRHAIGIVTLLAILFGIIAGLSLSKSITRQLNILHEMTELIGNGNFQLPEAADSNDEIGQLAKSIRIMSRKLAISQNELIELNKNMKTLAFHDPLTHLPNRRYGMEALESMLSKYNKTEYGICGIMFIDLDDFKDINDTKGHDIGDLILAHTADVMNHQISSSDLLCRIGGDEFLVIFSQVPSIDLVKAMAERIRNAVKQPAVINSEEIRSGCSIGIALIENEHTSLKEILKYADLALYSVKNSGRNNFKIYQGG